MLLWALFPMVLLGSCQVEEDVPPPDPLPWRTNVVFIPATNTPEVQINRFVEANNMDTVQTASGLVYQILDPGGEVKPTLDSTITAYYKGYLVDGRVFDESVNGRPLNLPLRELIAGFEEGVQKLGAGGRIWMLVRPSLAYGNGAPSNGTNVLVFEVELLEP